MTDFYRNNEREYLNGSVKQGAGSVGLVTVTPPVPCPTPPSHTIRFLRLPDVIARVGVKRSSIYNYIAQGTFPKQIALSERSVGWLEHEIESWLAARLADHARCQT
jgi:prophage regulatory protein